MNDRPDHPLKTHVERSTAVHRERAHARLARQRSWLRPRLQLRRHRRSLVLGSVLTVGVAVAAMTLLAGAELPSSVRAAGLVAALVVAYAVVWLER